MAIHFHEEDLPSTDLFAPDVPIAVDTEAMGLIPGRDRLCLVQLSDGRGDEHLVRFGPDSDYAAPNLKALLGDPDRLKLYHFARFDVAIMRAYLGIIAGAGLLHAHRVEADPHLHRPPRPQGTGQGSARPGPVEAAADAATGARPTSTTPSANMPRATCAISTACREQLDVRLVREGRAELAQACFDFLPARALLDLAGWAETDIFAHG